MKVLLISIGTRGDMEPFLAIGEILKNKGHEVICLFPEQFKVLAVDADLKFASLGPEFMEMLESDIGKFALGGGGNWWKKMIAYLKLTRIQSRNNQRMIKRQFDLVNAEMPDRIVHNGKAMYPVIWEVSHPGQTTYVSPVPYLHYVKNHTHLAFRSDYGEFLNKLTFKLADWGILRTIITAMKWLKISDISKSQLKEVLIKHKIIYTISPLLFPRPTYWKANLKVLGYHERDKKLHWQADQELLTFLSKYPKILFITFGSMTNPEPEHKTAMLLNILERNKIPTIINTGAGGLVRPKAYEHELIHFKSQIPYDWIFPKIYAVIHHGGSGTTHMALKYGCASMIIPHIIDQFIWNEMLSNIGVGPEGIAISKITEKRLENKIMVLMNNQIYKEKAMDVAEKITSEDFTEELYDMIIEK